jgi:hypothetical protein
MLLRRSIGCWRPDPAAAARTPVSQAPDALGKWLARAYVGGRHIESHGPLARFSGTFGRFRAGFERIIRPSTWNSGHVKSISPSDLVARASRAAAFFRSLFSSGVSWTFSGAGKCLAIRRRRARSSLHLRRWRSVGCLSVIFRFPWESGCGANRLIRPAWRPRNC